MNEKDKIIIEESKNLGKVCLNVMIKKYETDFSKMNKNEIEELNKNYKSIKDKLDYLGENVSIYPQELNYTPQQK